MVIYRWRNHCFKKQYGWHDRRMIRVPASVKTGTPANTPMHPFWLQWLDKVERRSITILYDRFGRPFSDTGLSDSEVAAIVSKTTETVHHYAKQANDLIIAKVAGGRVRKVNISGLV
jgi:hypothetical protein